MARLTTWILLLLATLLSLLLVVVEVNGEESFPSSICVTWLLMEECIGGDRALTSTDVKFTYNYTVSGETRSRVGPVLTKNNEKLKMYKLTYPNSSGGGESLIRQAEYHFEQLEHGGGRCNCLNIFINCKTTKENRLKMCSSSASIARRRKVTWTPSNGLSTVEDIPDREKTSPIQLTCNRSTSFIEISFTIEHPPMCNERIDTFSEGVEFSLRSLSEPDEWIPIRFTYFSKTSTNNAVNIGNFGEDFRLRGYKVQQSMVSDGLSKSEIQVCNFNLSNSVQFRWLQTSLFRRDGIKDVWFMDNINITLVVQSSRHNLLMDEFNTKKLDSDIWPSDHVRNGNVSSHCGANDSLVFGLNSINNTRDPSINSRSLLTNIFNLKSYSSHETLQMTTTGTDSGPTTQQDQPCDAKSLEEIEGSVMHVVRESETLNKILTSQNSSERISVLMEVTANMETDVVALSYLLGVIVKDTVNSNHMRAHYQAIMMIGNNILESSIQELTSSRSVLLAASTTFLNIDKLLLAFDLPTGIFHTKTITSGIVKVNLRRLHGSVEVFNSSSFFESEGPAVSVTIPLEILQVFDDDNDGSIRIASTLYSNVSLLLSYGLDNRTAIGSSIVGVALQCGRSSCTNNTQSFTSHVSIVFEHDSSIKDALVRDEEMEISCVFLDLFQPAGSILSIGNWSEGGCTKNTSLSSTSRTVCDCNHLTHFAILLSPRPPVFSEPVVLSLQVIGYVGVAISLIAMAATILTLLHLKSLHNMRNYIHIHLCINLSVAQILFVAGIDKTGDSDGDVPIHCQVVAVLLHYLFLVSFMWMLMEGVILYIVLVQVFVKHKKKYILAFTLTSYGLPLIYMGLLTLPLGFTLDTYGHKSACFLDPRKNFMWALIVPFLLIFFANIGFFIMAARIMWHHQKKNTDKSKVDQYRSWLRAAISLVVVMSLTWILGVLIVEVEEFVPLAYIYTIAVAFQGLFIFLVFIVFSKAVRDAYWKWWKDKVSESELLSRYFQETLTISSTNLLSNETRSSSCSSTVANIKDDSNKERKLSQDEGTQMKELDSAVISNNSIEETENKSYFYVVYVDNRV